MNSSPRKERVVILSSMLILAILGVALPFSHAGDPYCWFNKWILKECTWVKPPTTVSAPMGQNVVWEMKITVALPSSWGGTITGAFVQDRFGAEIEVDGFGTPIHGTVSYTTKGNSEKVFLTWEIGDLEPGQTATLRFTISTGLNGAGKQCYTSCGCYELNSGAVLKFMYNGKQYSVYSGPITVSVFDNQPVDTEPTETEPTETEPTETESPQVVAATVDVHPKALNLRSRGKWVTCFIELPEGYDVADIDIATILLNDTIPVVPHSSAVGDHDEDGVPDLMVKFNRAEVTSLITESIDSIEERFTQTTLRITGELKDGTPFEGSDTLKSIQPTMPNSARFWKFAETLETHP